MRHNLLLAFLLTALCHRTLEGQVIVDQVDDWTYVESTDAFTDEVSGFLMTSGQDEGSLTLACEGDVLGVLYGLGGYMGGDRDDRVRVRYRIDDTPASAQVAWILSRSGETAYGPEAVGISFKVQAPRGTRVLFEAVDPLDGERRVHEFSLVGLDAMRRHLPCL